MTARLGFFLPSGISLSRRRAGGGTPAPAPIAYYPTLLVQPSISGTATEGQTLTASTGTWANAADTVDFTYQWYRGRKEISGATNSTYVLTSADVGYKVRCFVTGSNAKGSWPAYTPFTAYVASTVSATHNIAFGTKTRSGHGGYPVGVGRTISSGNTGSDWTIDDIGDLVPSGTYGAAKTFGSSTYFLTLDNADTVAVTMQSNRFDVTARTGSASNNDTTSSFQLRSVLLLTGTGEPVLGDDIFWRAREFNATAADARFRMRSTSYSGTGRIGIYGLNTPRLTMDSAVSGSVLFPFTFQDCTFLNNVSGTTAAALLAYATNGWGVEVEDSSFSYGGLVANPETRDCYRSNGSTYVRRCTLSNMKKGITISITGGDPAGVTGEIVDNIVSGSFEDAILSGAWENISCLRNFSYDKKYVSGAHGDALQHLGFTDGANHPFGTTSFNVVVRNVGTDGQADYQPFFNDDSTGATRLTGATINNNIGLVTFANGIYLNRFTDPGVQYNTVVNDFQANSGGSATTAISVPSGKEGSGGNFTHNVANAIDLAAQTGATVDKNQTVARTLPDYQAMFPDYANTGLTTRAAVIAAFTPLENGTAKNSDGTYAGALLPNGCWNQGEVYA